MSYTLTPNVLPLPWITKPQSSTGLNWGADAMTFYSCLLLLDRCTAELAEPRAFLSFSILRGASLQVHGKALFKERLVNIAAGADQHGVVCPDAFALQNRGQRQCEGALHGQLAV